MLMSAELNGCVTWFIYFLDLLWVRYNCNSNYDKNDRRWLPIGKNKKVPGLFKDELGEKIIIGVAALRPKTYAYLMDDGSSHKKAKDTKKCVIKPNFMLKN